MIDPREIERLKKYGLGPHDVIRIERALCTLGDYEGPIKKAMSECRPTSSGLDYTNVCAALRRLVDGV